MGENPIPSPGFPFGCSPARRPFLSLGFFFVCSAATGLQLEPCPSILTILSSSLILTVDGPANDNKPQVLDAHHISEDLREVYLMLQRGTAKGKLLAEQVNTSIFRLVR